MPRVMDAFQRLFTVLNLLPSIATLASVNRPAGGKSAPRLNRALFRELAQLSSCRVRCGGTYCVALCWP
jgi:hypothetical protein